MDKAIKESIYEIEGQDFAIVRFFDKKSEGACSKCFFDKPENSCPINTEGHLICQNISINHYGGDNIVFIKKIYDLRALQKRHWKIYEKLFVLVPHVRYSRAGEKCDRCYFFSATQTLPCPGLEAGKVHCMTIAKKFNIDNLIWIEKHETTDGTK